MDFTHDAYMLKWFISPRVLVLTALILLVPGSAHAQAQWVHFATNGTLAYYADNMANRIPDFSFAGYQGGGVPLPYVPVKQTVTPIGGDNTASIQNAINTISALTPDSTASAAQCCSKQGPTLSPAR